MSKVKIIYTQDEIIERLFFSIIPDLQEYSDEEGLEDKVIGFVVKWKANGNLSVSPTYEDIASIKQPTKSGYIYILKSSGYYKIGISKNVKARIVSLQTSNPNKIELIHSKNIKDYMIHESFLHEKFIHSRINGEWFNLNNNQLEEAITYINDQN